MRGLSITTRPYLEKTQISSALRGGWILTKKESRTWSGATSSLALDQGHVTVLFPLCREQDTDSTLGIGRHVAMLELSKLIPEFFRTFEVTLIDPKRYHDHCVWLVVQTGLDVTLTLRDPHSLL